MSDSEAKIASMLDPTDVRDPDENSQDMPAAGSSTQIPRNCNNNGEPVTFPRKILSLNIQPASSMSAASHPKDDDDDDLYMHKQLQVKTDQRCFPVNLEVSKNVYHEFWDEHVRFAQEEIDSLKTSRVPLVPEESPCITYDINFEEMNRIIIENSFDEREELSYRCGSPASWDMEEPEFSNIKPHTDARQKSKSFKSKILQDAQAGLKLSQPEIAQESSV
ncbi:hypothetical protein F5879DRAFT_990887 [Lentinula edodes]|nr:hypothetical protein F5879DRAFT_990887 [Lentinula edodes]